MKLKTHALAILAMSAALSSGGALAAEKLWEVDDLKGPECAYPDTSLGFVYVSNVNGQPDGKDGNGSISRVSMDGKSVEHDWATGLDAPKGIARRGKSLFVADIDQLVEIDVDTGKVVARHQAPGAKLVNDVAVDADGNVYTSDTMGDTIYRLSGGKMEAWLSGGELHGPNGLLVEDGRLLVGNWGVLSEGWATTVPGKLISISLADKSVKAMGDGETIGNLDGLQPVGDGDYLLTDWMAGKVLRFDASSGKTREILDLGQGTADLGYVADSKTAFIPQMMQGKLFAYRID